MYIYMNIYTHCMMNIYIHIYIYSHDGRVQTPGPGAYEADAVSSIGRRTGVPFFVETSPNRRFSRPGRVAVSPVRTPEPFN